ncbi:MAG TPA: hypothetical protein VG324_06710 [Blastocatellia bacterium]|nr:hypothetical protein [Blastocatellia bacterium]
MAELFKEADAELLIDNFFTNRDVVYIHLPDGEYGCSLRALKVERGGK